MRRMNTHSSTFTTARDRLAGRACALGGAVLCALGALMATRPDVHEHTVRSTTEHTILVLLAVSLALIAPGVIALGARAARRTPSRIVAASMLVIALAGTISNVRGGDASWFDPVAGVTNVAWLACTIWLAIALHRSAAVARWVTIGLPLAYIATIPASRVGGGLVGGAFWIAVGTLLATGTLARRPVLVTA
jgi:hypothetical protein